MIMFLFCSYVYALTKWGTEKKAKEYNERAGACKPYSKAYLYNKQYFDSLQIS